MKTVLLVFLMLFTFCGASVAQTANMDSATIVKFARHDAHSFRYNKADKRGVLNNFHNPNSDYFKPTSKYASQPSLLNDSLYIKTFKYYALKRTRGRRTGNTLLIVGGSVVVVFAALLAAAASTLSGLQ
ncbi:MAG TPA: hypothetical protein VIM16_19495 [Mucilaginibacter sp.]|jgi:hypothetical protein